MKVDITYGLLCMFAHAPIFVLSCLLADMGLFGNALIDPYAEIRYSCFLILFIISMFTSGVVGAIYFGRKHV